MKITFLGTSAMVPTKDRNHPSLLLEHDGVGILFDCGEGTQRQLRIAGISPAKIHAICLSHWHGDHAFGLPGMLQTMSASHVEHEVFFLGPEGSDRSISALMEVFPGSIGFHIRIADDEHRLKKGRIIARALRHPVPNMGFAYIEDDSRRIRTDVTSKEGIPDGPWLGLLQKGKKARFEDTVLDPARYTRVVKGRKFVYITDTSICDEAIDLAKGASVLVCESTFTSEHDEKSSEYDHMTSAQAAQIASLAGVDTLILTHISQRYTDTGVMLDEARAIFPQTRIAHDFMVVKI